MDQKTKILGIVLSVAMLMIMIPVLLNLLLFRQPWLNYVFAAGAVNAALYLPGHPAGLYDMSALV